ncbi:MAG: hypothetical protein JO100_12540 [Pseudonocardia sp.]|nr:hypothetical protein [Pseudonocardia sp.]
MTVAFEVSPDDPEGLADAFQRAARGAVVHVVQGGRTIADIVPPAADRDPQAGRVERALEIERRHAERFGAPTLADYRKVYATGGWPWPGDDVIRRVYMAADAS